LRRVAVIGTVGVPASYGGFETLAENLVKYHAATSPTCSITVYCSSRSYPSNGQTYLSARLRYVPLNANGPQSIAYDVWSLLSALWHGSDAVLLLGISGAIGLPLARMMSPARIVTNVDGIEWHREKWNWLGKRLLRLLERIAVGWSHEVIADNEAVAEYLREAYGRDSRVVPYGGDHAVAVDAVAVDEYALPEAYAVSVCRVEPENNVHMVLEAFSSLVGHSLVMVGNWNNTRYGRTLRARYAQCANLRLVDAIYDLGKLKTLRSRARVYVHGHSAGGTNPSLVEAMHFGHPVIAFDCQFNRYTTEGRARYFSDAAGLVALLQSLTEPEAEEIGRAMLEIATRRYTWNVVGAQYFALLEA
jgi:glycosyltransferase involved in cell wall biosynthesis